MSCFAVWSEARLIKWEFFQQHQRTLSLFIRATICPPFFLTFVFFFCPQVLFHWIFHRCSPHPSFPNLWSAHVCVQEWIWFAAVGRCRVSVDASGWWTWGDDEGSRQDEKCHGLAEGPVLGRLIRGKKGDLGMRKWGRKKRCWDRIGEKSKLLWDRRLWDAKRGIGWGSWSYCPAI